MKKLSFFLMAMLISVMSFAETESITLSSGTHDGTKITWTAANGNITISQLKAASSTAVNASYIAAPRIYKGHILKFECAEGYGITNIDITYSGSYYGTSLFAGTTMTSTTVTANTTDLTSTFATSTSGGTHKIVATNAAGEKLIALQIPNNAASGYKQLRPTAIKVTYAKAASSTPAIACGDVNFGTVNGANTNTKELEVVGENLTEVITATLEEGSAFSVSGSLDETGGTLTVTVTATEAGQYTDQLTLTSGTTTKTVAISAKVVVCQGKGTKEEPYTVGDLTKLANPGTKAWVAGYIIGEITDNELSTSGFKTNSNIALAETVGETKKYAPIQLPTGDVRNKLNLVNNPTNLNKQVVLYGTLEAYYSLAGVKNVSAYEFLPEPVINHTITVSANPAEAGTVTGGGEFEETDEITVKAVANEGYEFVNWTENEVEVSTDAEYTFEVLADRALVANFKKAEPELAVMDIEMTNLVVQEMEGFLVLTASDDDNTGLNVMLALNADGTLNTEVSYMALIQGWNEVELPIVEGAITKTYNEELATDVYTGLIVVEYMEGKLGLNLTMYAKPVVVTDVVVTDATITVETEDDGMGGTYEIINVTANWNESVLKLEGIEKEFEGFVQIKETFVVDGEEDWSIWMCMNGVITTVDNVLTVTGEFKDNNNGDVYNVTISGKLPVVEPTTITYELNGGELPTATVPTQDSLIAAFKDGYNAYFGVSVATTRVIDNFLYAGAAVNNPTCDVSLFMKDDASPWKWLGDYVLAVTNAQIEAGLLVNLKELATELMWRQSLTGFFLQQAKLDSNYKGNADFTEAGKPEAWGAAYQAAHAVVLPTEPVAEDYTLPTPTKESYTFVGWYDNADGTGEAYKVIPAGWAGTLYAIWKANGPTTDLDNIAVEGKAVKAIINGQVLIMIGDKTFNMMGQQVK